MTVHAGQRPEDVHVGVFGGGIAGLTAAHELARRGFRVTVFEKTRELGGMAASQFGLPNPGGGGRIRRAVAAGTPGALPGEHGFRFFPAFYRHLNDTMKRIPLYVDDEPNKNGPITPKQTVFDRLQPTNTQGVALEDGRDLFSYLRGDVQRSFEAVLDELATSMDYLGATDQDIVRLLFKLVEYMSSSEVRRRQLENVSWADFVELGKFSPRMRVYVDTVPRALVAMSATEADARTQGNILLQLALDQLGDPDEVDRTLDGPTTDRWITPWVAFLRDVLNVTFETGVEFTGFKPGKTIGELTAEAPGRDIELDAYVLAIPHQHLKPIFANTSTLDLAWLDDQDLTTPVNDDSLGRLDAFPDAQMPAGPMAVLSGIQYFLPDDVKFVPGHVYYPDSDWGLSSISQAQFWGEEFPDTYDRRGVLSVDIGDFRKLSSKTGKSVFASTADEIAQEVWRQLRAATKGNQFLRVGGGHTRWTGELPPNAPEYMLDRYVQLDAAGNITSTDAEMLINRPGEFARRPGHPDLYRVHLDQIVMAGPWMQTYTRLTTMEAANESARHAVNALLAAIDYQGEYCTIWNPEENEPVPFERLKSLDERLVACGIPHVFQALGLYAWIDCWVPTTPSSHDDLGTRGGPMKCEDKRGDCCDPSPLDQLMTITGMDMHQLAAVFEVCPEDLLEAERVVKNDAVEARAAEEAFIRGWMEGRPQMGTFGAQHWSLLEQLASRELTSELVQMMQGAVQAITDARQQAAEADVAFEQRVDDVPSLVPLSKIGLDQHRRLLRVATGRLRAQTLDEEQLGARLEAVDILLRRYLPGYLAAYLATRAGANWFDAWVETLRAEDAKEGRPEGWGEAELRPPEDAPLDPDALAEADRILPRLFPRPPKGARKPETSGATDGPRTMEGRPEGDAVEEHFIESGGQDLPDDLWLSSEIVPNLPKIRPWKRRKHRVLPSLLAGLADRR